MRNSIKYEIRLARKEEYAEIYNLLENGFFKFDPLTKYMKEKINFPTDAIWAQPSEIKIQDPALVAVKEGKIIGLSLNYILNKKDSIVYQEVKNLEFSKIVKFLNDVNEKSNFWSYFPEADKCLSVGRIYVDNKYTRLGIATNLINKSW